MVGSTFHSTRGMMYVGVRDGAGTAVVAPRWSTPIPVRYAHDRQQNHGYRHPRRGLAPADVVAFAVSTIGYMDGRDRRPYDPRASRRCLMVTIVGTIPSVVIINAPLWLT